jgi:hypothetical protein
MSINPSLHCIDKAVATDFMPSLDLNLLMRLLERRHMPLRVRTFIDLLAQAVQAARAPAGAAADG